MTDLYERLREDHDRQRTLLGILAETKGASEGRSELFARLRAELQGHAAAEERTLYARMIAAELTVEKARHSVAEHKEIDDLVEQLEETDQDSPGWLPGLRKLREVVEHHLDEEEHEVFQMAGKVIDRSQAESLAATFDEMRRTEDQPV